VVTAKNAAQLKQVVTEMIEGVASENGADAAKPSTDEL
jgi:hypothetical protein